MSSPIGATQRVALNGYEWVRDRGELRGGWTLSERAQGAGGYRTYDPLESVGLFNRIRELDKSKAAILAFANQWGMLGGGDSLSDWRHEIKAHIQAWELSKLIEKRDSAGLAKSEVLQDRARFRWVWELPQASLDPIENARHHLAAIVSGAAYTTAMLRAEPAPSKKFSLTFKPLSLRGALWLQFALHLIGGTKWERCAREGCGEWFRIGAGTSTGARRADAKYHDEKCRHAAKYAARLAGKRPK